MPTSSNRRAARLLKTLAPVGLILLAVGLGWWLVGRLTLDSRRLVVTEFETEGPGLSSVGGEIRVLTWNLAHGRGDERPGLLRNFGGGDAQDRVVRLYRIAAVLEQVDAHVVILNEVDFRASWSGDLNQAEILARTAGYRVWVQQVNYDLQLPVGGLSFGNAVLTRLPVQGASFVELPPHSRLEALLAGAKEASLIRMGTPRGPVSVVPVHLEPRSEETRLKALSVFRELASREGAPMILAGDFNSSPPSWVESEGPTIVGELLKAGFLSPRATAPPSAAEWTFPTFDPAWAIDWVLVEPPLEVTEARVLEGTEELSDHAPVLAVVRFPEEGRP